MKKNVIINIVLVFLMLVSACSENINDVPNENIPPETHLFLYPDSTISQQKSKLKIHWWGDDPDGLVIGYFIKWQGIDSEWTFTKSNDSLFALPIGTVDTTFSFYAAAVDNSGNGKYDKSIVVNNVDFGSEPYVDANKNGKYDDGEKFTDIGAVDASPANQKFPIKNTAPEVAWDKQSVLPATSFPVMTVGWNAEDLDGNETITEIQLALNDTANFISLAGNVGLVTLIIDNVESNNPSFNVYINGNIENPNSEQLQNLKLNDFNRLYVRAKDNSGASSKFVMLPDEGINWFVQKPSGQILIIDDYASGANQKTFYKTVFDGLYSGSIQNSYNVLDLEESKLPYTSITFLHTLELFKYIYWYSDSSPSIDLTSLVTQTFLQNGGKIFYSMTFQDSSANYDVSLQTLQNFLPIESLGEDKPLSFLFAGANVVKSDQNSDYPNLKTASTIGSIRTFNPNTIAAAKVYDLSSSQKNGGIGLMNSTKNLFFIGLPLDQCNGNTNINQLFEKVFNEFGFK